MSRKSVPVKAAATRARGRATRKKNGLQGAGSKNATFALTLRSLRTRMFISDSLTGTRTYATMTIPVTILSGARLSVAKATKPTF